MINDIPELKDLFLSLGYTFEEYHTIINNEIIKNYSEDTLIKKVKTVYDYLSQDYTRDEIIKISKILPSIYCHSIENIKQKRENMESLGYTKEEVIKMTKRLPAIYCYSIENMKQKIEDIMSLGYSREEVIKMTKELPILYGLSIENIKQKIEDIMSLGYTKEEVIKITVVLPQIYCYSLKNIKQKIDFYDSINMHELATVNSRYLMQSTALSYARYMFFKDIGIEINMDNYKKLFPSEKHFEKQYGITKKLLLKNYIYKQQEE